MVVLFWPRPVTAQELTPRAYWPAPVGTRVISAGIVHTSGDMVPDPTLPITGIDSTINTAFFAYRQTLSLWGRTTNFIVELPFSDGSTSAANLTGPDLSRDYQGFGDAAATLSVNLLGAPSMNREEFGGLLLNPHPLLGASVKVVAPTGRYDPDRLINVGSNRWAFKAELGYIHPVRRGWLVEVSAGAWYFGDNDDLFGQTREQDPISSIQAGIVHVVNADLWLSFNVNAYRGGRSSLGDRRLDDLQRDSRVGFTAAFPIGRGQVLKASLSYGSVNDSDESFNSVQLSYSRVF